MFNTPVHFDDVAHAIQLALTPVFLLTGIAGILNVMTGRLARILSELGTCCDKCFLGDANLRSVH